MIYKIQIIRAAQKQILSFKREAQVEIVTAIDSLRNEPRPVKCKKLRGAGLWRLRIGHYRVIYAINDRTHLIMILKVAVRRDDTYEGF